MTARQIVAKAPNSVLIICGTAFACVLVAGVTATTITGKSADPLFQLLNVALNGIGALGGLGAIVAASAAAKSSAAVESKVNPDGTDVNSPDRGQTP